MANSDADVRTIALVTGANKGIGRAIAEQLAAKDITVLLGTRNSQRGEDVAAGLRAAGGDAHQITLDVTDPDSVQAAYQYIHERFDGLDVLVNNAGLAGRLDAQGTSAVDLDVVREVFETNVFGVIAVTNAMLPLLRRSLRARIVNMSSGIGSIGNMTNPQYYMSKMPGYIAYPPSKTALNSLTVQYAKDLRTAGILVNACDPGACDTDLTRPLGQLITRTAEEGAVIAVHLATLDHDGPTGGFFNDEGPVPW